MRVRIIREDGYVFSDRELTAEMAPIFTALNAQDLYEHGEDPDDYSGAMDAGVIVEDLANATACLVD